MANRAKLTKHKARENDSAGAQFKTAKRKRPASTELAKVTLYVRPEQVLAIEAIQLAERKRTGSRPDKSALVQEALDLLIRAYKQVR